MLPLNQFIYTKDLGFPAENLLIKESKLFTNQSLISFLIDLDKKEYKHLIKEDALYRQANKDWKEMNPLLSKIVYVGLIITFGSALVQDGIKSKIMKILWVCSFITGSAGWMYGITRIMHYSLRTGFKKVAEARLNRLNAKVQAIQLQILSLENCSKNVQEREQLNEALTYFKQILDQWDGRIIRDGRIPFSYLKLKLMNK